MWSKPTDRNGPQPSQAALSPQDQVSKSDSCCRGTGLWENFPLNGHYLRRQCRRVDTWRRSWGIRAACASRSSAHRWPGPRRNCAPDCGLAGSEARCQPDYNQRRPSLLTSRPWHIYYPQFKASVSAPPSPSSFGLWLTVAVAKLLECMNGTDAHGSTFHWLQKKNEVKLSQWML